MPRMKPVVSALARQTITAAFEDLERTVSPADAREMRSCTALGHVRTAALDIEKQLGARQALRNMRRLAPLLNGLEHYAKVVDVLCNGTPMVSWIWSPIILILRVASEYVEAFEQLMKGYARIATALSRFELLSNTFSDPDFQHSLAVYYADILQFHKHAYKFVRRSGWRLLFLTSWGRFQRRFDNILDDLERHGDLIDRAASARNVSETRQLRQDICSWKEESLEQVKRDEEHQADKQYRSILSWLRVDETEQLSIYESIFEEGSKFPGTCAWMVKNGKIASWLQRKPSSNLLWLQGNPGSGKSVMSTQLVNFLRTSSLFVMSHFCSQTYATTTRYEAILRSLLHQLLRRNGELVAYTYQEYVVGKRLPATSNLEQLIETLLDALSDAGHTEYVWVIIDGIEDCELARQARLITFLGQIAKPGMHGGTVCKVLVSSRAHPIRLKRIWQKQVVSLSDENETEQLTKAIKLYASQRLRLLNERLQQLELNADEVEAVEEMVAQKAAGMFLYARLVLDYLGTNIFYSGDELKQSIHQLPETITEFYRNLLAQMLSRLDPRSVDRIRCTLSWIAYAKRPLKRLELLSALAFSSGNPHVSSPAPRYTLELCSPLVEERRDTTLSFVHASVKEFLETNTSPVTINPDHAVHEHGLASVSCLLAATTVFGKDFHQEPTLLRLVKGVHALHIYSTEYWTEYLFAIAATVHGLEAFPALISLAYSLTEALELLSDTRVSQLVASSGAVDDRLSFLDRHPRVKRQIERALWARSAKRLESEILEPSCATRADFDGVSKMLDVYQKAVEVILDQDSCAGASTEELELFKSQFRTSAYTCRLRSCPRATVGFDSGLLRHEHEIGHAGGFQCSFPGCHYPPFRTKQSLDSHGEKCHASNPARKSIRRVGWLLPEQPRIGLIARKAATETGRVAQGQSGRTRVITEPSTKTPNSRLGLKDTHQDSLIQRPSPSSTASQTKVTLPIRCKCDSQENNGKIVLCGGCSTWQHISCYYNADYTYQEPLSHRCDSCPYEPPGQKRDFTGTIVRETPMVSSNSPHEEPEVVAFVEAARSSSALLTSSNTGADFGSLAFVSNESSGSCTPNVAEESGLLESPLRDIGLPGSVVISSGNPRLAGQSAHIPAMQGLTELLDPSTKEDLNDPKVIANRLILPVPTKDDFPTVLELYYVINAHSIRNSTQAPRSETSSGIHISDFISTLFRRINKADMRLLVHMSMLISNFDALNSTLIPEQSISHGVILQLLQSWKVGPTSVNVFPYLELLLHNTFYARASQLKGGRDSSQGREEHQQETDLQTRPIAQRLSAALQSFSEVGPVSNSLGKDPSPKDNGTSANHAQSLVAVSDSGPQNPGAPSSNHNDHFTRHPPPHRNPYSTTSAPQLPSISSSLPPRPPGPPPIINYRPTHYHPTVRGPLLAQQSGPETQNNYGIHGAASKDLDSAFLCPLFNDPGALALALGIGRPLPLDFPSLREIRSAIPTTGIPFSVLENLFVKRLGAGQFLLDSVSAIGTWEFDNNEVWVFLQFPLPSEMEMKRRIANQQMIDSLGESRQHDALPYLPHDDEETKSKGVLDNPRALADALGITVPPQDFPSLRELHSAISPHGTSWEGLIFRFKTILGNDYEKLFLAFSAVGAFLHGPQTHDNTIETVFPKHLYEPSAAAWIKEQKSRRSLGAKRSSTNVLESSERELEAKRVRRTAM